MTHFGAIVGLLASLLVLITGILGFVIRATIAWTQVRDTVKNIQEQLIDMIKDRDTTHSAMNERLVFLEQEQMRRR